MSTTDATGVEAPNASGDTLAYEVFVNDPPPQGGVLPNGEPRRFSPMASTLIYGRRDAVLTDPGMTADQVRALGDRVEAHGRNLTDIFVTHGHGDHWFAAGLLAERFGARVVAAHAETRAYLDDAEELLRIEATAVGFFDAKVERYPDHLGRYVLWAGTRGLYGAREDPGGDIAGILLGSWL